VEPDLSASLSKQQDESQALHIPSGETHHLTVHLEEGAAFDLSIIKEKSSGSRTRSLHFKNPLPREIHFQPGSIPEKTALFCRNHWQTLLIALALLIYLATRLISLDAFPIYFFTDEAIQTNRAAELVANHWHGEGHELLPTYFINGGQYNLGVSVYAQLLPYLAFGKSIWVTRGVSVLISLLAALAIGLMMRRQFNSKQPFLAVLLLSITPAWFLHSRTAFETVLAVSFYAAFIYCYLMYRSGKLNYIFAAVAFAALTFYSYSPAQMVLAVTLLGLLILDLRYHWQNRKKVLFALGLGLLFLVPYLRYLYLYPDENFHHLQILDSYWTQTIPLSQKLAIYFKQYLAGLNPVYWFYSEINEIVRHIMKGYGYLIWWSFPLVGLGLVLTCLRLKKPEYRILLLTLFAAPSGAALVSPSITRALFMVIPATLLAAIALDQIILWLGSIRLKQVISVSLAFVLLAGANVYMLRDALVNGPTWYQDYGLYGMQYGAKQVFGSIHDYLQQNPDDALLLSSSWANGTDNVARFFFDTPLPFQLGGIDQWMTRYKPLDDHMVFVLTPEEMDKVSSSPKFTKIRVLRSVEYPNGQTGFYFVKLAYVENIQQVLADEISARRKLYDGTVTLQDGSTLQVQYSLLDMGTIQDAFDGNNDTVIRTAEANPLVVKLIFAQPYTASQVIVRVGGGPTSAAIEAAFQGDTAPMQMSQVLPTSSENRDVVFDLGASLPLTELTITIKNKEDGEPSHVHLWEIKLQ